MIEEQVKELLFAYFSGAITDEEKRKLVEWLNANEENKKIYQEMADEWAVSHVPLFIDEKENNYKKHIYPLMTGFSSEQRKTPLTGRMAIMRIAASLLILLSVSGLSFWAGRNTVRHEQIDNYLEAMVPLGSQSQVTLPDRSTVWLNAGTTLSYSENNHFREVALSGEAYFQVAADSLKPFRIQTGDISVEVLGTSFNVKSYEDEENIEVTLVSGSVNVTKEAGDQTDDSSILLEPDQMLTYNKLSHEVELEEVRARDIYAWKDGFYRFEDKSFSEIVRALERHYNSHIIIHTDRLAGEIFSGSLDLRNSLEDILREIDVEKKYAWRREGENIIVIDK